MELSKKEKRELREIVGGCYEEQLSELLGNLYEDFQKWGGKYINAFELTDRIHEFHDRDARELYKMYVMSPPEVAIIYALGNRSIRKGEIDKSLLEKLGKHLELLENLDEN